MLGGKLTQREREIIHHLLVDIGENTGFWKELSPDEWGMYNKLIKAAQRRLKEKALSAS